VRSVFLLVTKKRVRKRVAEAGQSDMGVRRVGIWPYKRKKTNKRQIWRALGPGFKQKKDEAKKREDLHSQDSGRVEVKNAGFGKLGKRSWHRMKALNEKNRC